jgi:hypothetical protein
MHNSKQKSNLRLKKWITVTGVILFGAVIRLVPLISAGPQLPFRSGGLFLEFSRQILSHGYHLPAIIPFYSDGGIPFAYPPLPFYAEALLIDIFPFSEFTIANLLPPLIGIISLPFFYLFAKELKLNFTSRVAALAVYATMPAAFLEIIESAGLAEAFGSLAIILYLTACVKIQSVGTTQNAVFAGISWAACILASPGSAYAATLMCVLLVFAFLVKGIRDREFPRRKIKTYGIISAIAITLSSPYWITVIRNHGTGIFINSFINQHEGGAFWLLNTFISLARFNISKSYFSVVFDGLILGGIIWEINRHRWKAVTFLLVFFIIPREGVWLVSIPAAILAGISISEIFTLFGRNHGRIGRVITYSILVFFIIISSMWEVTRVVAEYSSGSWSEAVVAADWVQNNTPHDAKLIVLSDWQIREWLPTLTQRTVLNVWRGLEWEPEEQEIVAELNQMLNQCIDLDCIYSTVVQMTGYHSVYLYIDKSIFQEMPKSKRGSLSIYKSMWENDKISVGNLHKP